MNFEEEDYVFHMTAEIIVSGPTFRTRIERLMARDNEWTRRIYLQVFNVAGVVRMNSTRSSALHGIRDPCALDGQSRVGLRGYVQLTNDGTSRSCWPPTCSCSRVPFEQVPIEHPVDPPLRGLLRGVPCLATVFSDSYGNGRVVSSGTRQLERTPLAWCTAVHQTRARRCRMTRVLAAAVLG